MGTASAQPSSVGSGLGRCRPAAPQSRHVPQPHLNAPLGLRSAARAYNAPERPRITGVRGANPCCASSCWPRLPGVAGRRRAQRIDGLGQPLWLRRPAWRLLRRASAVGARLGLAAAPPLGLRGPILGRSAPLREARSAAACLRAQLRPVLKYGRSSSGEQGEPGEGTPLQAPSASAPDSRRPGVCGAGASVSGTPARRSPSA